MTKGMSDTQRLSSRHNTHPAVIALRTEGWQPSRKMLTSLRYRIKNLSTLPNPLSRAARLGRKGARSLSAGIATNSISQEMLASLSSWRYSGHPIATKCGAPGGGSGRLRIIAVWRDCELEWRGVQSSGSRITVLLSSERPPSLPRIPRL